MFSNILCLILYLPFLIHAYPPKFRFITPPPSPTPHPANAAAAISTPTGDTLNRTVCYCASPQWLLDRNYGSFYNISYYNAHQNRTYTLEPACASAIEISLQDPYDPNDKPRLQNECLESRFHNPMRYCTGKESDKDVFCYTWAGGADYDSWSLNGQSRTGLPLEPEVNYSADVVEQVCEQACKEKLGGMEMLKGDTIEVLKEYYNYTGERLWSSVVFYPSIPDMCDGCK